jgi:hypothetical protein
MRAFSCEVCAQRLFFENDLCLRCGTPQGFDPDRLEHVARGDRRGCANALLAACNWLVADDDPIGLCVSCRLTRTRPNDGDAGALEQFAEAEQAKRRLVFELLDTRLPIGADLHFDLLSSRYEPVVTGHDHGVITLDLAESDDARREARRAQFDEPYRTLLGHFRHEIGHYYWPRLVEQAGADELARARTLFGDERASYQDALDRHYAQGPPDGWDERYVSAYATTHPSEDWAESFSHYLHMRDTLQTAAELGLTVGGAAIADEPAPFPALVGSWLRLAWALNEVNRSMGRDDLYPFTLADTVVAKLAYVEQRVAAAATARTAAPVGESADRGQLPQ